MLAVASRSVAGLGVRVFILARPATRRAGSSFPPLAPGDPQAFFSGVLFWTLGFRGGLWGGRQRSWPEHVEAAPMCVSPGVRPPGREREERWPERGEGWEKKKGLGCALAHAIGALPKERGREGGRPLRFFSPGCGPRQRLFHFFFLGKCCFLVQKVCKNGSVGLVLSFACAVSGARANPAQEQLVEEAHVARDIGAVQVEVGVKGAKRLVVVL